MIKEMRMKTTTSMKYQTKKSTTPVIATPTINLRIFWPVIFIVQAIEQCLLRQTQQRSLRADNLIANLYQQLAILWDKHVNT